MKTKCILIPTDFSVSSLSALKAILSGSRYGEKLDIILLHGTHLNDSITELLFFSKHNVLRELVKPEFSEALMILKNKYQSGIANIREDIFTGFTQSAFNLYVEANHIEEIYVPEDYASASFRKRSFSLLPYIKKSGLKVNGVGQATEQQPVPEKGQIAEILFNSVSAR